MDYDMKNVETMTPAEAGKVIHKNAEFIRAGLRQNRFPFGTAVQSKSGTWNYVIIKEKFREYVGLNSKTNFQTTEEDNGRMD